MQSIKKLCTLLKNCLYKCFRDEEDDYRDRVIELEERIFDNRPKSEHGQHQIYETRNSQPPLLSNVQSPKKSNYQSPSRKGSQVHNGKPRHSSASADSYFTVNSGTSSIQTISRRKFKRTNSLKKSLFHGQQAMNSSKVGQFKDMYYDNSNQNEITLSRVQSQYSSLSDALYQWNEAQYQRISKNVYFQISKTEQSKLSSNLLINQAVNKIQDFYTFYFNDLNSQFVRSGKQEQKIFQQHQGYYFRKYPQFKCIYHTQKDNMNPESNYMVLMKFQSNTASPLEFLKWYNSLLTQLKLFNFQKVKLIQNGIYPVYQIQQFGSDISQKYTYLTVRQIEVVKFQNEPDVQYVMQLDCNFRKGQNFKSLIRFSDSQAGLVQIYCQLSEKINCSPQKYYQQKFRNLQQILKQRLLNMSSRIVK